MPRLIVGALLVLVAVGVCIAGVNLCRCLRKRTNLVEVIPRSLLLDLGITLLVLWAHGTRHQIQQLRGKAREIRLLAASSPELVLLRSHGFHGGLSSFGGRYEKLKDR